MASVNKVIIVGHLGRDPEVRYAADGAAITTLSIATSSKSKDKATGETREETEWHRVVFFGRAAEVAGQYLKKGSAAYVEGRLRTRKWTDKQNVERYTTEIVGDQLQLLSGRDAGQQDEQPAPARQQQQANAKPKPSQMANAKQFNDMDDDIPF